MDNMDKLINALQGKDAVTDIVIRDYRYWREEMLCSTDIDDQSEIVAKHRVSTLRVTLRRIAREVYGIDWQD